MFKIKVSVSYGYLGGGGRQWRDKLGDWDRHIHTNIDN